ncbi:MAG TPA: peptidoglycan bridge formation glycyltransferase FemA/FemB family protein [Candidatus Dormibacteraeota bacterium]|nr:peptidoglycan bridge formation glycyltransferase FemA/FemB family protein [Candidatus Dormibacteraeota bacterium]
MGSAESWDRELEERASPSPLLQSWAWGEVQSRAGWTVERVRLDTGAMASVHVRRVGPVREAYVPRGPVPATREAIEELVAWARGRRFARLRVEPEAPAEFAVVLRGLGFAEAESTQPANTRIVPLGDSAGVLAAVDRGTRYNIRLAERRGVVVEEGSEADVLADQSAAVEERSAISLPRGGYYKLLLSLLPWCRTYVARHPETNEALSAVLVARHAGRGYNLFAGRSGAHSDLKSNELAHWRAVSGCAAAGLVDYDLWGVPPAGAGVDHPWHGIGDFKAGFGGRAVNFAGAWQLVLSETGSRLIALEKTARRGIRSLKRNIS